MLVELLLSALSLGPLKKRNKDKVKEAFFTILKSLESLATIFREGKEYCEGSWLLLQSSRSGVAHFSFLEQVT